MAVLNWDVSTDQHTQKTVTKPVTHRKWIQPKKSSCITIESEAALAAVYFSDSRTKALTSLLLLLLCE